MDISTICILGGTGFVGSNLSIRLSSLGYQVKIPSQNPGRHQKLSAHPDITLVGSDIHDPDELARQFAGMDAVINLVGILNEKKDDGQGFEYAHVELTRKIIDACNKTGVNRLLHMSALHADAKTGTSYYLKSKGKAEEIVLNAESHTLHTSIFRPSVIFGPNDSFFNRFAGLLKMTPLAFPLACPNSRFAPVYVNDVCEAFVHALEDSETFGKRYDLCGPDTYTLKQLVEYTAKIIGLRRSIIGLPDVLSKLQSSILEFVPGKPFSRDNYRSLLIDSICKDNGFEKLGIKPAGIDAIVPTYLT